MIECRDEGVIYSIDKSPYQTLKYPEISDIEKVSGSISYNLKISANNLELSFNGVSSTSGDLFIKELKSYASSFIAKRLESEKAKLLDSVSDFKRLKEGNFYLNQSKISEVRESLPDSIILFEHPFFKVGLLSNQLQGFAMEFLSFADPRSKETIQRNKTYVAEKKEKYRNTFDTIEKYPLTEEQRTAVVTEEDNILVIAAAGSGKSSTLVAKIFYLLEEGQFQANQIVSFAYNKDAQLDLESKIDELFNRCDWSGERVSASTFHGFGMEVLAKTNQAKPSIAAVATGSKQYQLRYFIRLVEKLRMEVPSFIADLLNYYSIFKYPQPRAGTISSFSEYKEYLQSLDGKNRRNPDTGKWSVLLTSMNGVEVKSLEELRIANWLFLQGINFEYERRYTKSTADENYRQYYPDFYYPDIDLWHEHFAIDEFGKAPAYMNGYENGVEWKRILHSENQTQLFETHSAHFSDGSIFDRLDQKLKEMDVPRRPPSEDIIDSLIKKVFNPRRDLEPIIAFLKHFKTNNLALDTVNARAVNYRDILRAKSFLKVFEAVYKGYQKDLANADEIDFEDLIHKACDKIEQGAYKSDFDYIMVDEFQDASQDRLRLIKALAGQRKHIKLFAVGDDWQSIYRFSGADIQVMKTFPGMFGFTEDLELTKTFRSAQEIIDVASEFVQRNPDQFNKSVKATFSNGKDSVILKPYDPNCPDQILENLLVSLQKRAQQEHQNLSVFILTRYIAQEPKNLPELIKRYPNLDVQWKTIHASKGLEADCVIIHHLNGGSSGFPCEINDDPIMDLVIPKNETFPHAEERRLLYVAITRAKKLVYGFYHPRTPSIFVRELSEIPGVKVHDPRFAPLISAGDMCPRCKSGVMSAVWVENTIKLLCSNGDKCGHSAEIRCPECKVGEILPKKARNTERTFFGCNQFPTCKHIYKESISYTGGGFRPY